MTGYYGWFHCGNDADEDDDSDDNDANEDDGANSLSDDKMSTWYTYPLSLMTVVLR